MSFSERLKAIKKQKGLTTHDIAVRMNVTDSMIRTYQNGGHCPKMDTVQRFADALGVPVGELIDAEAVPDSAAVLPADARQLLDTYNALTGDSKAIVLKVAELAAEAEKGGRG